MSNEFGKKIQSELESKNAEHDELADLEQLALAAHSEWKQQIHQPLHLEHLVSRFQQLAEMMEMRIDAIAHETDWNVQHITDGGILAAKVKKTPNDFSFFSETEASLLHKRKPKECYLKLSVHTYEGKPLFGRRFDVALKWEMRFQESGLFLDLGRADESKDLSFRPRPTPDMIATQIDAFYERWGAKHIGKLADRGLVGKYAT